MSTARLLRTPTSPLKPIGAMPRAVARPAAAVRVRRSRPAWQRFWLAYRKELVLTLLAVLMACALVPFVIQNPSQFQITEPTTPPDFLLRNH